MGFEHWIMQHFWLIIAISLILLVLGHIAVVWLMRQTGQHQQPHTQQASSKTTLDHEHP